MSERYYVVSDKELQELAVAAEAKDGAWYDKIYKACRAREVPEWATHFAGEPYKGYDTEFKKAEEIKR